MPTLVSQLGVCNFCQKTFEHRGIMLSDENYEEYYFCSYDCLKKFLRWLEK